MKREGIKVYYDGKKNIVFYPPDYEYDYLIGEMTLNAMDTPMEMIKAFIDNYMLRDETASKVSIDKFFEYFKEEAEKIDSPVAFNMAVIPSVSTV